MIAICCVFVLVLHEISAKDFHFIDQLLKYGRYDKRVRPLAGQHPVNITNQITITSLAAINEQTFTFKAEFYFRHWWNDPRLVQNVTSEPLTSNTPPETLLWTPGLSLVNAHDVKTMANAVRTIISSNGDIYLSRRIEAVCTCTMNLEYYPMDTQVCPIRIESYAFTRKDMRLFWHATPVVSLSPIKTSGYTVEKMYATRQTAGQIIGDVDEAYDNLIVNFKVKRTFLYFVYRIYSPTILLLVFNLGSYWIPASAVPARVTLIVTTFLASTFILQSVSEQTVKVPYTTPMQLFLLVNIVFIVFAIVEYVVILYFMMEEKTKKREMKERKALFTKLKQIKPTIMGQNKAEKTNPVMEDKPKTNLKDKDEEETKKDDDVQEKEEHFPFYNKVDIGARVIVTFLYVVFCCTYFIYYLYFTDQ